MGKRLARIENELSLILPETVDIPWINKVAGQDSSGVCHSDADLFLEPGRALLRRGGKRWRPLVTVLTCEALGGGQNADALVGLIEIPHNGSLIIDDIEDSSLMRRGGPAIHLKFGTDLAINMGNLMYFLPTVLFENGNFDANTQIALMQEWLAAMRRLHLGQGYDILWHSSAEKHPDRDAYIRMVRFKTGSLASLAACLGARAALFGKANKPHRPNMTASEKETLVRLSADAWEDLGCGFQILDDAHNLSHGVRGKDRGDDIVEGKKSLPLILHLAKRPQDKALLAEIFAQAASDAPSGDWSAVNRAIDILHKSGSILDARNQGCALVDSGREKICSLLPDSEARELLLKLIDGFKSE